jgi:hypothetical protein
VPQCRRSPIGTSAYSKQATTKIKLSYWGAETGEYPARLIENKPRNENGKELPKRASCFQLGRATGRSADTAKKAPPSRADDAAGRAGPSVSYVRERNTD